MSGGNGANLSMEIPAKGLVLVFGNTRRSNVTTPSAGTITTGGTAKISSVQTSAAQDMPYSPMPQFAAVEVQAGTLTASLGGGADNHTIIAVYFPVISVSFA